MRGVLHGPLLLLAAWPVAARAQQAQGTEALYVKWCAGCHGEDGKGDGPAAARMLPRPRDFTQGLYQIRTTPSGALPLDTDLRHVIDEGMPGTAMPGWKAKLSVAERDSLVAYVKHFSHFFASASQPPEVIAPGRPPGESAEGLAEGRKTYEQLECFKCHGQQGRGDGPSATTQQDDYGFPIRPADLSQNWRFNGGGRVEDIYMRLRTGLDGTPMPSFSDLLDAKVVTEEQLWRVAQYVRSLSPEKTPAPPEIIRAERVTGALPSAPDDSAWNGAERYFIPLVGQIVQKPRWFSPSITAVWVQALHNDRALALRLTWDDRSRSPSTDWSEWQQRVQAVMEPKEGADSLGADLPDALAVEFPRVVTDEMERPYFLMGDRTHPVDLWQWRSQPEEATEVIARGSATIEPLPGSGPAASAVFDQGQWRLQLTRPLTTADTAQRVQLRTGQAIPIALFAWDGSNGESGTRGAISSWYFLYLAEPTPSMAYVTPLFAILLTAGLGVLVIRRAQKREGEDPPREST